MRDEFAIGERVAVYDDVGNWVANGLVVDSVMSRGEWTYDVRTNSGHLIEDVAPARLAEAATPEGTEPSDVSADDVRLLALLDDGEHDPTDPRYEALCERGMVEFSARCEGWDLTEVGRRVVDASPAAAPEGDDGA